MRRTDLICESGIINDGTRSEIVHNKELYGTKYTDITLDERLSAELERKKGRYITVFTDKGDAAACIAELLADMLPEGAVLAAGLGNKSICSDSLGSKAIAHIPATAHLSVHPDFKALNMRNVYAIEAGVTGKTGIESSEQVISTARHVGAKSVIVIDSLACTDPERLCTTVQITDTGIAPGSGVGNDRKALDRENAGIPVIALGVPTVIDLESLTGDENNTGLMVTPRTIDISTERLAAVIGSAVSMALNPSLTKEELDSLIIY